MRCNKSSPLIKYSCLLEKIHRLRSFSLSLLLNREWILYDKIEGNKNRIKFKEREEFSRIVRPIGFIASCCGLNRWQPCSGVPRGCGRRGALINEKFPGPIFLGRIDRKERVQGPRHGCNVITRNTIPARAKLPVVFPARALQAHGNTLETHDSCTTDSCASRPSRLGGTVCANLPQTPTNLNAHASSRVFMDICGYVWDARFEKGS